MPYNKKIKNYKWLDGLAIDQRGPMWLQDLIVYLVVGIFLVTLLPVLLLIKYFMIACIGKKETMWRFEKVLEIIDALKPFKPSVNLSKALDDLKQQDYLTVLYFSKGKFDNYSKYKQNKIIQKLDQIKIDLNIDDYFFINTEKDIVNYCLNNEIELKASLFFADNGLNNFNTLEFT